MFAERHGLQKDTDEFAGQAAIGGSNDAGRHAPTSAPKGQTPEGGRPLPEPPADCPRTNCAAIIEGRRQLEALELARADLLALAASEHRALAEQHERIQHTQLLAREAVHRLLNGLQMVSSLLALQARKTDNPEASAALQAAARRVETVGSLHHQLHRMDEAAEVDLKGYLDNICAEMVRMLAFEGRLRAISFTGVPLQAPASVAIPLGFICAELMTNAAKYSDDDIAVRLDEVGPGRFALSVTDHGPGLAPTFDPAASTGLGMKIITSLVKELSGEVVIAPGEDGAGARFAVLFSLPARESPGATRAME